MRADQISHRQPKDSDVSTLRTEGPLWAEQQRCLFGADSGEDQAHSGVNLVAKHVKGERMTDHARFVMEGNEKADELATEGARLEELLLRPRQWVVKQARMDVCVAFVGKCSNGRAARKFVDARSEGHTHLVNSVLKQTSTVAVDQVQQHC